MSQLPLAAHPRIAILETQPVHRAPGERVIIFVSTSEPALDDHRRGLVQALRRGTTAEQQIVDGTPASEAELEDRLERLPSADVVICLVGADQGPERGDGSSYCEAELAIAHRLGTPVLAYDHIADPPRRTADALAGYRRARLQRLRAWLREHYPVTTFTTPDDLAGKVSEHIALIRAKADDSGPYVIRQLQRRLQLRPTARFDTVSVTLHNLDVVYSVDAITPGHEERVDAPSITSGGAGANLAFALGRLGRSAAAVGMTAADGDGQRLRRSLRSAGVNTEYLLELEPGHTDRTGRAIILANRSAQRTIYTEAGANDRFAAEVHARGLYRPLLDYINDARIVHVSSFTQLAERQLQERLVDEVDANAVVALTPGALYSVLGAARLAQLLRRANILFTSDTRLEMLLDALPEYVANPSDDLAHRMDALLRWRHAQGSTEPMLIVVRRPWGSVAVKDRHLYMSWGLKGYEGAIGTEGQLSGEDAATIRDGPGTGAALAAGVLHGMLLGRPPRDCADLAFVMTMSTASRFGTRSGLPAESDLRAQWQRWLHARDVPGWL